MAVRPVMMTMRIDRRLRKYLEWKAREETQKRGDDVPVSAIVRALIQREMDLDMERQGIWDG